MGRLITISLVMLLAVPAGAARRVTIAQLEESLWADRAAHRSDTVEARRISDLELVERLTDTTLDRLEASFKFGPHALVALQLLADQSAFLDPPNDQLLANAAPDAATQQQMLAAARMYAIQTWSRLPNFFVTRVTTRFDDNPHPFEKGDWPLDLKLQPAGSSRRQVTFRDGREVEDTSAEKTPSGKRPPEEVGLHSWGEFGSALTVVLSDMAGHKVAFRHWEQTASGLVAVFRYEVPRDASHYAVVSGYSSETVIDRTQFGGNNSRIREPQQVANIPREQTQQFFTETPAYHGTLSIDPATGAVMRLTIQAELSGNDPLLRAETMVQYGTVTIGDRQFICPVRSLAISLGPGAGPGSGRSMTPNGVDDITAWGGVITRPGKTTTLLINETAFVDYHRLGSTSRILTDAAASGMPVGASPQGPSGDRVQAPPAESSAPPNAAPAEIQAQQLQPQAPSGIAANTAPAPGPQPDAAALGPKEPVVPEISMSAAGAVPDQPANQPQPSDAGYWLKVTSRLVDVGLVAYDKKGRPLTDLKATDFELYDNGHKQEIRFFGHAGESEGALTPATTAAATGTPQATTASTSSPEPGFTNRAPSMAANAPVPASTPAGATILLIDQGHIAWADMDYARHQILKFLGSVEPGERVGLYSMTGLGFRVLTEVSDDHAALIARLQKFVPSSQSVAEANDEETRNRQHFDEVHNVADLNSVNGNHIAVPDAEQPIDPQLMTMGDDPTRASLVILVQVARHLAAIPGQKKLVWISSDNVFADWGDQAVGLEKNPKAMDALTVRAQEAMNEAHAAVYPFDVSQLQGGAIAPDLEHPNVELTPAAQDTATVAPGSAMPRNMTPGRISAEMSQDIHAVQGSVRQVADATGGRVVRRAGDLAAQLKSILADEHASYMLSFSPQGPPDGQYHTLTLKPAARHRTSLRYRQGYFFETEPATLRDRFQRAIWRPTDLDEIALSAKVDKQGEGATLNVSIATGDLGMQEQGARWMDRLDIFFVQRDDAGLHAQLDGETLGLRLKSATYERLMPSGIPFERVVTMKPGMGSLRILVVDENTGRMGSVTLPASAITAGR